MQPDDGSLGNVGIEHAAMGCADLLVVYHQAGKPQVRLIAGIGILAVHLGESFQTAQPDGAVSSTHGRVPVEPLTEQSVYFAVVIKGTCMRVVD